MKKIMVVVAAASALSALAAKSEELAKLVAADTATPVRRGGVEGRPYWNAHSIMFMYPPAFGFAKVDGAVKYRFDVLDDVRETLSFVADSPEADLSPVWPKLRVGYATVTVTGVGADGRDLGVAGRRTFWRKAEFREGAYPKAKYGYAECAGMIYRHLFSGEDYQPVFRDRKMARNVRSRYPAKMLSALIEGMVRFAEIDAARRTDALTMARNAADVLIGYSEKADARYPHFPPTYSPDKYEANYEWPNRRKCMTPYPADAAHAYLALCDAVKSEKYLMAARGVAETYLAFQGKDGTWPLTIDFDQEPYGTNRLIPLRVVTLFERLFALTGEAKYRTAGDRAFGYVEKTLIATWNWEGQFEDTPPTERYKNLTKHPACDTALYLLARYPGDKERLALARELLRFAEDQFVNWERPFDDGKRPPDPKTFTGYFNHFWDQDKWIMPSVFEQYGCYTPVDASAAKLIRTYLALYRAEGNPLDLAKARALGDTATRCTSPDGLEATWWTEGQLRDDIWPNCMFATAAALHELANAGG